MVEPGSGPARPPQGGSQADDEDERRSAALALVAQDHRRLIARWEALVIAIEAGGDTATVRECIVGLIDSARDHFVNEEWALRTVSSPNYLSHKSEHARLLRDASDMLRNFDVAFTPEDWPALAAYFRHWLATHHRRHDDGPHGAAGEVASAAGSLRPSPAAHSPTSGAGSSLERADDVVGDPAAIEAARLRGDPLAINGALLHRRRVEGEVVANGGESRRRLWIAPGGVLAILSPTTTSK